MAMPREEVVERDVQAEETEAYAASQWQLMWWKFRKHHLAMAAGMVIVALYVVAVFCEFLAPYTLNHRQVAYAFAPPQRLQFVSDEGVHFWPFVYGIKGVRHPETLRKFYIEDRSQRYAVRLFVRGAPYRFWGLFETDVHLFGVDDGGTLFLLGTDHLGRGFAFENYLRFAHFADDRAGGGDAEFCVWSGDRRGVWILWGVDRQSHSARD